MRAKLFLVALLLVCSLGSTRAQPGEASCVRSLAEYGDISTVEGATKALQKAFDELMAQGGGIVEIPANAPEELNVSNNSQTDRRGPGVSVIDYRGGFVTFHPAPMGKHQDGIWGGVRISRELNLVNRNLGHCSTHSVQSIHNNVISGASSYMATLTEPVKKGKDRHCYVDLIRGIWVGQYLNITSSAMGYAPPYDRVVVKGIGWDPQKRCNYFVADLEHDHAPYALVYNKDNVNGLVIDTYSNCDNQTAGQLWVKQHQYGVGDNFTISGWLSYMSDVFCGFGDEGAVVLNAETIGEIDGFHSTVEAVDWSKDEITYAPGIVNAQTLSNSRPLINMNRDKWITQGSVHIVPPDKPYRGKTYPGIIGGPHNAFNYQGGLVVGSKDCPWTEDVIGRFFTVTDPSEVILPHDPSLVGGYAKTPDRPIYRWYRIKEFRPNPDGTKLIKILRVRWAAVAAGAPKLFLDDNYTWDGHERPLSYAIAPGAWVYDISEGWADVRTRGGYVGKDAPRKLKLVPHGDRGTRLDFEPGDPIEQPPGPDPWQPRPLRIRHFDQMPSTMDNASIEVLQNARVQIPTCIGVSGIITSRDQLPKRKDGKPPYDSIMRVHSLSNVGIDFQSEVMDAAIVFRQPNGHVQPVRWANDSGGSSTLTVPPQTGDFVFAGGNLSASGRCVKRLGGLSATDRPARNLRGIAVPVAEGSKELQVNFQALEEDDQYAVAATPSWLTTFRVVRKGSEGFTVEFGEPAPGGATIDWIMVR